MSYLVLDLIFIFYTNDIVDKLKHVNRPILLLADDCILCTILGIIGRIYTNVYNLIRMVISRWYQSNTLVLNA